MFLTKHGRFSQIIASNQSLFFKKDRDGVLSRKELCNLLLTSYDKDIISKVDLIFDRVDSDSDAKVSFSEFLCASNYNILSDFGVLSKKLSPQLSREERMEEVRKTVMQHV